MPDWGYAYRVVRHCNRNYRWSSKRGGCRLEPGHKGDCKPGRYKR
jgi:hypothetical protein